MGTGRIPIRAAVRMDMIEIVMPMAGRGERFRAGGIEIPKPLIEVRGQPMFLTALSSLKPLFTRRDLRARVTFVVAGEDQITEQVHAALIPFPMIDYQVCILEERSGGPADSVDRAAESLHPSAGLLILDCDLYFESREYFAALFAARARELDGCLCTFAATSPRYSYVEAKADRAIRVVEKEVISDRALAGAYFFTRAELFFNARHTPLPGREAYVSQRIEERLRQGHRWSVSACDLYESFGTPEELRATMRFSNDKGL